MLAEAEALTDITNRLRQEAMEDLTRIEIKFAKVREALFIERTAANEREREAITDGAFDPSSCFFVILAWNPQARTLIS